MFRAKFTACGFLMSFVSISTLAGTLHVPAQYSTIQAAIDAATNGDTVMVADGVYTGTGNRDVTFLGKALTVRSASGDPNQCVIDCQASPSDPHKAFYLFNGDGGDRVIQGFTVRNGFADPNDDGGYGGAVYCERSVATIRNCAFENNTAGRGGALYVVLSPGVTLVDCSFTANTAAVFGGAFYPYYEAAPLSGIIRATRCTFTENIAPGCGAIKNVGADLVFTDCTFTGNRATDPTSVGGVMVSSHLARDTFTGCRFSRNRAGRLCGAIEVTGNTYATFTDCTFEENFASSGGALGIAGDGSGSVINCLFARNEISGGTRWASALWVGDGIYGPASATVVNCTFSGNVGPQGTGAMAVTQTSQASASNCIFWGNTPASVVLTESGTISVKYSDVQGGWSGTGNINADPLFVDPNANYRLRAGSPGIDAGDNTAVPVDSWYDLDGNRRFIDDPLTPDTGVGPPAVVDMGCYEYQGKFKAGDLNCDGAINFGDVNPFVLILGDLNAWQALYPDCPRDNADVNYDRQIDFGDINPFVELLSR